MCKYVTGERKVNISDCVSVCIHTCVHTHIPQYKLYTHLGPTDHTETGCVKRRGLSFEESFPELKKEIHYLLIQQYLVTPYMYQALF